MVNIAVLGCGKICHRFVKGLKLCEDGRLYGFGSREIEKAKQYAEMYEVTNYGSYDDMLSDPNVDAVYISTINNAHYDMIEKSLKAKKHVICEKPMVESKEKYQALFNIAKKNDVLLMEAIKGVFLPANKEIKKILANKELGELSYVHAAYVHNGDFPETHWVNDPVTGGCLQDLGSYPGSVANFIIDSNITKVEKKIDYVNGAAGFAEVLVDYENGVKAELLSSYTACGPCYLEVYCSEGYIRSENFWKSDRYEVYKRVNGRSYERKEVVTEDFKTDFYYEIKHFIKCINEGKKQSDVVSLDFNLELLKLTDKENY